MRSKLQRSGITLKDDHLYDDLAPQATPDVPKIWQKIKSARKAFVVCDRKHAVIKIGIQAIHCESGGSKQKR